MTAEQDRVAELGDEASVQITRLIRTIRAEPSKVVRAAAIAQLMMCGLLMPFAEAIDQVGIDGADRLLTGALEAVKAEVEEEMALDTVKKNIAKEQS